MPSTVTGEAPLVVSPQVQAYLDSLSGRPPMWERTMAELRREGHDEIAAAAGEPEPVALVEDVLAGAVPSRLYRGAAHQRDVLVWFHGGGWMLGDIDCFDPLARALANRARCAVLAVDYRLAPEHVYPAAVEDAWAATLWALRQFSRTAVGGDSSGGNLAAAVARRARDAGVAIAMQLLVYPVLDYAVSSAYYEWFRRRYAGFAGQDRFGAETQDGIRHIWDTYVPEVARRPEPDAAPLRAASLSGLAPACVIMAEHDILRGEGEEYVRCLREAGIAAESYCYPGQIHGFFHMLSVMDDAQDAVGRAAGALRRAFA
jgi:acetyl esterase